MTITLNTEYDVALSTALLGYVGETNARPVSVEGLAVDGADRYVLTIDYGDGVTYEVDITGGTWTPTADILRSAQTVSCQISAKKLSGDEYILVKKSRIFRLRIGAAIGDTAIPSPSVAADALDRIDAIGRQAHADMQTAQSAAETATTAANNAAKSATNAGVSADTATQAASRAETAKAAAETAAQTAQSIADSLPDDYVTAVGKIAENTAEIGRVKLTDKELQRRVDALYSIGQGVTHRFETDTDTAYAKTVPTGGKLMSVKNVGGRSIVFNQNFQPRREANNGATVTADSDGTITINGTTTASYINFRDVTPEQNKIGKYMFKLLILNNPDNINMKYSFLNRSQSTPVITSGSSAVIYNQTQSEISLGKATGISGFAVGTVFNDVKIKIQIFDLTAMFGSGNEPSSVEEFEKIFPADYYPYNAGEIICAGVESVAVGDTAHPIPEAIKALPGYGWSAGTARNYVDYENKRYVQCVNSVDLGTLTWTAGGGISSQTVFIASSRKICGQKLSYNSAIASNILCSKYLAKSQNEVWSDAAPVGIATNATIDGYVYVNDTAYTDATAFKQAMQGVMLYYELETPIVTDISDLIDDDFLRNIEVEAGGSITFKNSNDNYHIPVPSEEEYIVKLSEVGGTA